MLVACCDYLVRRTLIIIIIIIKFHFSVDFESYGAVHTTFTTKTMVEMGVEHVILARGGLVSEIRPGRKVAFWAIRGPGGLRVTGGPKTPFSGRKAGVEAAGGDTVERCEWKKVAGGRYGPRGEGFGPF